MRKIYVPKAKHGLMNKQDMSGIREQNKFRKFIFGNIFFNVTYKNSIFLTFLFFYLLCIIHLYCWNSIKMMPVQYFVRLEKL